MHLMEERGREKEKQANKRHTTSYRRRCLTSSVRRENEKIFSVSLQLFWEKIRMYGSSCCHYCLSFCKTIITRRCQLLHRTYWFLFFVSSPMLLLIRVCSINSSLQFTYQIKSKNWRKDSLFIKQMPNNCSTLIHRKQNGLQKLLRTNSQDTFQNGETNIEFIQSSCF